MKKTISLAGAAFIPLLAFLSQAQVSITTSTATKVRVAESAETPQAVVLSVNGKCHYSTDGTNFSQLKVGQVCEQGAVLRTEEKARTDLFFRRIGSTVRLQEGTEVKLEMMKRTMKEGHPVLNTLLDLRSGRIFTVVRALVPGSTLEIRNAAGRSVVEGGGDKGRYIITSDGTQIADKESRIPLKILAGDTGITIIKPGQKFDAKEGKALPLDASAAVEEFIALDEIQSLAEELTPALASKVADDSQALVLSVGENSTYSKEGGRFEKLKVGQVLTQGATIRSGDDTVIDLFLRRWGTTVRLIPNTELVLEKMTKTAGAAAPALMTRLNLQKGRIFCFIRVPVANSKFEVKTAKGTALIESAGAGRYDIRANGAIVAGKSSFNQIKVVSEDGVKVMVPGQSFNAEDGHITPAAPSDVELLVIQMDQLVALAEHLTAEEEAAKQN
jgi:hypothetical protein